MKKTKQKILDAALKLFNEDGMVNVRLQHIADEAFVSVGNLAYHYASKEKILLALYETLTKKQEELLAEYRVVPLFDNIDLLLSRTFSLQQEYVFFYLDTLEVVRAYPSVKEAHQQHISFQTEQLKSILAFNAARGALMNELYENGFEELAIQIWMTMNFWLTQHAIRQSSQARENQYKSAIWLLLQPYFTPMGKLEYRQMLEKPYDFYF
ncbi:MAG: TetR/AcrR family transcriptional regulator [Bacteroidota bacterium]